METAIRCSPASKRRMLCLTRAWWLLACFDVSWGCGPGGVWVWGTVALQEMLEARGYQIGTIHMSQPAV